MKSAVLPVVDVVIPLYNGGPYIEQAVRSVLGGSVAPQRIIVVDDGSTDNGPALVESMSREHSSITLVRQANQGPNAAREHGRRISTAPLIAFLDADDAWEATKLEEQLHAMTSTGAGVVYCAYHHIDAAGKRIEGSRIVPPQLRGHVFDRLLRENRISGSASSVLIERAVLDLVGPFDAVLRGSEDLDMWLRLARLTTFDFVDRDLVAIRLHENSAQQDHEQMLLNMIAFYSKWIDEARSRPEVMRHWGHLLAEFAMRIGDRRQIIPVIHRTFKKEDRALLFTRAFGSFRAYLLLKRLRAILPSQPWN